MAGNTYYAVSGGSATVTLPPFTAFGTEIWINQKWENIWLRSSPYLAMIKSGQANWNKDANTNGTQIVLNVNLAAPSTRAAGVALTGTFTPITPYATSGATAAAYQIAHYRGGYFTSLEERLKINNKRGNFMTFKVNQMMDDFTDLIAGDLASSTIDADNHVLGMLQPLSTSNTVGEINQSTDTDWASNVQTGAGAFSLDLLDDGIAQVNVRRGKTTHIALATLNTSTSTNLFAKLQQATAPLQRLVNTDFKAKFGFTNIEYEEAVCFADNRIASGTIAGFDATTWYYNGNETPQKDHEQPVSGTDAVESIYYMMVGVGCSNPAKNWKKTGVS